MYDSQQLKIRGPRLIRILFTSKIFLSLNQLLKKRIRNYKGENFFYRNDTTFFKIVTVSEEKVSDSQRRRDLRHTLVEEHRNFRGS